MGKFTSLYNVISKLSIAAGFCFPGMLELNTKLNPISILYCIVSTIPCLHTLVCCLILYYTLGLHDIKLHGFTTVSILTIFDTFYYLLRREEYNSLLCNFDEVTKTIIGSNFMSDNDVRYIINRAEKFNSSMKFYVAFVLFQRLCPTVITYVLRYVFGKCFVLLEVPYSVQPEFAFHITACLQFASGLYAFLKTACSWTVMFLLLYHITVYLKTLGNCLENFNSLYKKQHHYNYNSLSETGNIFRLRSWIQLHQKILSLIRQFNKLYSPLLLVHLFNFYASALCFVFAITMQKEGLLFTLPMLGFVAVEIVVFLALCTIGNELTYQSGKIFQNGYVTIHLLADKGVSSCGLIIGEVAKRPIIVSVFGSEYFNLTLDAFIWMVKSMASFYVGLTQIEKLNENYDKS